MSNPADIIRVIRTVIDAGPIMASSPGWPLGTGERLS
jgi:hypothetical protein